MLAREIYDRRIFIRLAAEQSLLTIFTKVESPEVRPLLEVRHAAEDPHGVVVEHGRVPVPRRRAVEAAALRHHVPSFTRCNTKKFRA